MKERTCNFCTIMEDSVAWIIGWFEGCVIGCIFACSEDNDSGGSTNIINEMINGAKTGFSEGEWLGHLDK
uniref:Uncharacterized protein n=1 Tax=viral metagenome TaxID=1070528 RepID=A0A6C0ASF7_9ZZZZ